MPTSGKTWTVPGDGGICLQITPASRKRVTATGDPTGPHGHQRRAGGGQDKGTGLSGRPPKPVVKSVPRTGGSKRVERAGPSTASLTISPARARPGQTCFRIGTLKKFRGAPMTTVSPEGTGHGRRRRRRPKPARSQNSLALPESATGLWENDEEAVSDARDTRVRPHRSASPSAVLRRPPRTAPAGPHLRNNSATRITARKSSTVKGEHSGTRPPVQPGRPLNARARAPASGSGL